MSNEKTNRAAHLLAENVTKLMETENYKAALKLRKKMHHYSFSNVYLIGLQCPLASYVMGYQQWKALGRQVRKGEAMGIFSAVSALAGVLGSLTGGLLAHWFGYSSLPLAACFALTLCAALVPFLKQAGSVKDSK